MPPKKIVYLFGAGATTAEWQFAIGETRDELSLRGASEWVITQAKEDPNCKEMLSEVPVDSINDIEHYISLLESVHTKKYLDLTRSLRLLFCRCIQENLKYDGVPIDPSLTMALLEMHTAIADDEKMIGTISLNYDNLLDRAHNAVFKGLNYGMRCKTEQADYNIKEDSPQLIKLHGSFNWRRGVPYVIIDEKQAELAEQAEMLWIPPSVEKESDTYPFNLLWGKAFEMLEECDILRVVGCRLSQNDWGLTTLLFNTQIKLGQAYRVELVCPHEDGIDIKRRNGFLKNAYRLGDLENCQDLVDPPPQNAFESWLRSKLAVHRGKGVLFDQAGVPHIDSLVGEKKE